jgi:hypothetical protein
MRKIFIINVGVNASHGRLRSPIFRDETFEFMPIPEDGKGFHNYPDCPLLPRYRDLKPFNKGVNLLRIIPDYLRRYQKGLPKV